jgi:hypothetical protein
MGTALGCCSKNDEDTHNVNMMFLDAAIFNNRDKLRLIVRIQAVFRGYLTRKRVRAILEAEGVNTMSGALMGKLGGASDGPPNYENPDVLVSSEPVKASTPLLGSVHLTFIFRI